MPVLNKILIVKLSSLGDIIHTFPAITEFSQHFPNCQIDWLVDEVFSDIPAWLAPVNQVYTLNRRQLRKYNKLFRGYFLPGSLRKTLKNNRYDAIIDLYFSKNEALFCNKLGAPFYGLPAETLARIKKDPVQADYYQQYLNIDQHIDNLHHDRLDYVPFYRNLMALSGNYQVAGEARYSLVPSRAEPTPMEQPTLIFMHSTSGESKVWPIPYWQTLANLAHKEGYRVLLPWGDAPEKNRAKAIAAQIDNCEVLPRLPIDTLMEIVRDCAGLIGGDTGFTHIASIYDTPVVRIWGATYEGAAMPSQRSTDLISSYHCAPCMNLKHCEQPDGQQGCYPPCYREITPEQVWEAFKCLTTRST